MSTHESWGTECEDIDLSVQREAADRRRLEAKQREPDARHNFEEIIALMKRVQFSKLGGNDASNWSSDISVKILALSDQFQLARKEQELKERLDFSEPFKAWPSYRLAVQADIIMNEIRMFEEALDNEELYFMGTLMNFESLRCSLTREIRLWAKGAKG